MNRVIPANSKIGWLVSNGRPDAAAAHYIFAREYKKKSSQLVKWCNDVVKHGKSTAHQHKIWPIPLKDIPVRCLSTPISIGMERGISKD